jgi:hypothetical protein
MLLYLVDLTIKIEKSLLLGLPKILIKKLHRVQNAAARLVVEMIESLIISRTFIGCWLSSGLFSRRRFLRFVSWGILPQFICLIWSNITSPLVNLGPKIPVPLYSHPFDLRGIGKGPLHVLLRPFGTSSLFQWDLRLTSNFSSCVWRLVHFLWL